MNDAELLTRLEHFRELEANWDSYESDQITDVAIWHGQILIATYPSLFTFVAPLCTGGVMFSIFTGSPIYSTPFLEVEIGPEGQLSLLTAPSATGIYENVWEGDVTAAELCGRITQWQEEVSHLSSISSG